MTVARELSEFLTRTSPTDLPEPAIEHAAMLIASTLASAAFGSGLQSAKIIRDLAQERGGRPDASLWFHAGPKLPVAAAARPPIEVADSASARAIPGVSSPSSLAAATAPAKIAIRQPWNPWSRKPGVTASPIRPAAS